MILGTLTVPTYLQGTSLPLWLHLEQYMVNLTWYADHYGGLNENWQAGSIYCSEQTARLLQHMDSLRIKPELIVPLPMDQPQMIQGSSWSSLNAWVH